VNVSSPNVSPGIKSKNRFAAEPSARALALFVAGYREPKLGRSLFELAITAVPLAALWIGMWYSLELGYWLTLLLAIPASGFLLRLFMIQHDCGHGAFFRNRQMNDWLGRTLGVVTLTPYEVWRKTHALHHATTGNLDRRGMGDIDTLTVHEFSERSFWGRIAYRIYRNPVVMFAIGPAYLFILRQRLPIGMMGIGWRPWASALGTNLAIAVMVAGLIWLVGATAFFLIHIPIVLGAATAGVWLFFVQHQFEGTQWSRDGHWDFHEAALYGSSHYDLPPVLRWFTGNIGMHHLHHLCSRIPHYRLPQILRDRPDLAQIGRITLWDSLGAARLALWDEGGEKLVSFREARAGARVPLPLGGGMVSEPAE